VLCISAIRLAYQDVKSSSVKACLFLLLLFAGTILYANYTPQMVENNSIADVFHVLFRDYSLTIIVIPVFLFLLSIILPSVMEPLRLVRYQDRGNIAWALFTVIVVFVSIFLILYMLFGFLYGWWLSGSLENTWKTEWGPPYIASDGNIDLALFSTGYMVLRYVVTQFVAFMVIGLSAVLIYIMIPRFVYVFFIIEGLVVLDRELSSRYNVSWFIHQAEISIANWGDAAYFISIVTYFVGLMIVLSVAIYIVLRRKDFIPKLEDSTWHSFVRQKRCYIGIYC